MKAEADIMTEPQIPSDTDAEEAVLGSILIDSDMFGPVMGILAQGGFYREKNQWIWEACQELYRRGEAVNQITVARELARKDKLKPVGGAAYLVHLIGIVPTPYDASHYARIVHRLAIMRELIEAAGKIAAIGYNASPDIGEALQQAMQTVSNIAPAAQKDLYSPFEMADMMQGVLANRMAGKGQSIEYGWPILDEMTGGMRPGDLILLAARPEVGKTTLAQQIAMHVANAGQTVLFVSAEMPLVGLGDRYLAAATGQSLPQLWSGHYLPETWDELQDAIGKLAELGIWWQESGKVTTLSIRAKIQQVLIQAGNPLGLVILDYLQLLSDREGENQNIKVANISRNLKLLAREFKVPVLAVSQLSRALEYRQDKRPTLSDLRDSGALEQDADQVLMLYRPEFAWTEEDWIKAELDKPYPRGELQVLIAKHRQLGGGNRVAFLQWDKLRRGYVDPEVVGLF